MPTSARLPTRGSVAALAIVGGVRRAEVWELRQQIAVRAYVVPRHLPVREERDEMVGHVVGQGSPVLGIAGRTSRVVWQDVWQQRPRHTLRILRRVPACVLQDMREAVDEAVVGRRLTGEVRRLFVA